MPAAAAPPRLACVSTQLPRSRPSEQGVDPRALRRFVEAVDSDPDIELHSVMVLRHGHVVAEGWWAPHTPERARLVYSVSKSFTSSALGFALAEGLVSLDDTLLSYFPELDAEVSHPWSRDIRLRHLASMTTGHDRDLLDEVIALDAREPVRGLLLIPPDREPGTLFAYSQPSTYALAAVIQRVTGVPLSHYLRPRLFDPLGIGEVWWQSWPRGRELGFSGIFVRTEDIAKLGQLYLQRGRWNGVQLLSEEYVAEATSRHIDTPAQDNVDWQQGYGFQFWMARHGYRGDGAFGQFCVVLPELDAVVATTGGTEAMQAVLDHLWTELLPGLEATQPDETAEPELKRRLAALRLSACEGKPTPSDLRVDADLTVSQPSAMDAVLLRVDAGGIELTLTQSDNAITFPARIQDWLISSPTDRKGDPVPVAASAGWQDDETLRVEVLFLETAHRMDVVCTLRTRSAEATWRTTPLDGGALATLHRPV